MTASAKNDQSDISKALMEGADKVFDGLLSAEIADGKSPIDAKKSILVRAVDARYGPNGRAMKHMLHFLSGSGQSQEISLSALLKEDAGVRARIEGETVRRANGIQTLREIDEKQRMSLKHGAIDPSITLFQKNFAVDDWCGALGTFALDWSLIACPARKSSPLVVQLSGKNEYRWHPGDERLTRRLHQFAQELIGAGAAKPFMMTVPFTVTMIDQINNKLIRDSFLTQANPKNNSILNYFTSDQLMLAADGSAHAIKKAATDQIQSFSKIINNAVNVISH